LEATIAVAARRVQPPMPLTKAELADIDRREQHWRGIVGSNIRKARQATGMSLEKLSVRADVGKNYLHLVEHGRRSPTVDFLTRLAYALDISPADFMTKD
jgi:ribosome-binding protein aMBF1 (putative translation factor)